MRRFQLSGGWLFYLLAIIGILLQLLPVHDRSGAQAAQLPPVVTIDDEQPKDSQPVEGNRIATLEASVDSLAKRLAEVEAKLAQLSQPKAPAGPPSPPAPKAAQEQPKSKALLRMYAAEWCVPCKQWLSSREAELILGSGISLEIVDIDKLSAAERPAELTKIPYFELWAADGTLFIWHRGPLTLQRFRDMERDLLARLKVK